MRRRRAIECARKAFLHSKGPAGGTSPHSACMDRDVTLVGRPTLLVAENVATRCVQRPTSVLKEVVLDFSGILNSSYKVFILSYIASTLFLPSAWRL